MTSRLAKAAGSTVKVEIRGFNAVAKHFEGIALTVGPMTTAIVGIIGMEMARLARQLELPHFKTGATFFSIAAGDRNGGMADVQPGYGGVYLDVGTVETHDPETTPSPQARLLEFGFIHVNSGRFIQYPFMIPAARAVTPDFERAMFEIVAIGARRGLTRPSSALLSDDAVFMGELSSLRNSLYSSAKFLGDLNVILGLPFIGSLRSLEYGLARGIGDLQATMRGAIGTRITHRVTGRFTGAGISVTRSAVLSGPSSGHMATAQRIYNRMSGQALGRGLRGSLE